MNRYLSTALAVLGLLIVIAVCALAYRYFGVAGGAIATLLVVAGTGWSTWRTRRNGKTEVSKPGDGEKA